MKCRGKPDTTWTISRSITFSPQHFKSITYGTVWRCCLGTKLGMFHPASLFLSLFLNHADNTQRKELGTRDTCRVNLRLFLSPLMRPLHMASTLHSYHHWGRNFRLLACLKSCHVVALSQCYKLSPSSAKGYFFRYKFSSLNRAYTGPWRTFRNNHDYSKSEKLEINVCSILATRSIKM